MQHALQTLDPLTDPRWAELIEADPGASVFHSPQWLRALQDTYGYRPVVVTAGDRPRLTNGIVFSLVKSWLTGKRLISLPFSDHCQPLGPQEELSEIVWNLRQLRKELGCKYLELRPTSDEIVRDPDSGLLPSESFSLHTIDLRPAAAEIYRKFHDSCIRRKIKKAEREKLVIESGNSPELLRKFRHLFVITRRRHKLPPQPGSWFENLARCMGDRLKIYVASTDGKPAASILTLSYKKVFMYKYGCSDAQFHNLGGMPLLFWNAIQEGKQAGMETFDLGRSSAEDPGLLAFKGHLGAVEASLRYYRDTCIPRETQSPDQRVGWAREALSRLPQPLLEGAGTLLYRHFA